ncbi:MAG: hypothetical protein KBT21_09300 [Treponema sp.]|nr:hypothetical protein [Candidatus Treponema merdequi]
MNVKIKIPVRKKIPYAVSKILSGFGVLVFIAIGVLLLIAPTPLFSAPKSDKTKQELEVSQKTDDIVIEKTNYLYNKGLYYKAVEEINIAIENHQGKNDIPDNVQLMGEASYFAWINSLYKTYSVVPVSKYNSVISCLTLHPEVMSSRIISLVDEMFNKEKIVLENDKLVEVEKNNRNSIEKIQKKIYKLEQAKKDLEEVVAGNKTVKDIKLSIQVEKEYQKARTIKYLMITLYVLIFISIVILIFIIHKNHVKTIQAQAQFETTMKVVAILQRDTEIESPYSPLSTPGKDLLSKSKTRGGKKSGLTDFESEQIALEYFTDDDSKKKFLELQNACIELGERIDRATGRKRNSKKVSELVFKLCKVSGVDDELSLIYYCAGMVYDAGFLSVPRNILQGEHLTIKERYEVRSHVQKAGEYFVFIPEDVRRIFLDAAEFHHENVDGKGYLAGLTRNKIPLIARFIRVAESYISLINSRSYKKIMDADSALKEMQRKNGIYDPNILALLEKVI